MDTMESHEGFETLNRLRTESLLEMIRSLGFRFAAFAKDEVVFLKNTPAGKKIGEGTVDPSNKDIVHIESDRLKNFLTQIVTENPGAEAKTLLKIIYPEIELRKQIEQQERENL